MTKDKHRHDRLMDTYWDPIVSFLEQSLGIQPTMELEPISPEEWLNTLRKKKSKAATGPDGWARADLLAMPFEFGKTTFNHSAFHRK